MIRICNGRPQGRVIALYNEAGLDRGPQKYEAALEDLYSDVSRRFPGATVYTVVLKRKGEVPEDWAKAYIDYTDAQADNLARIARAFVLDPQSLAGYNITYDPAEQLLHVGFWLFGGYDKHMLKRRQRLWRKLG